MDADLDLNTSGPLKDGTRASQSGGFGATSADLQRGFQKLDMAPENEYADDPHAQENLGGAPKNTHGGFLGRPEGWQR